ncbi:maleylpyruvate isomerase family mycothiol-dependent enzyme [Lipingzhangella sp. LS1_29]|uniref:Maleylpyruvate isomerase family mycothiol-dependent enzyme n=1 Tax=Lipingzhangella rawalii TaxID=2055835 RepID=A0ABU2HBE0_9ACTN|nr:maleylpyruvate isomerase family mycothiol-dependent enzyme [Lipingzhangella rawalii]MDS1272647.1 maleylpyruvate isomerase family mycothiol-dependent enzyme [Lipingzhangella rawalii]
MVVPSGSAAPAVPRPAVEYLPHLDRDTTAFEKLVRNGDPNASVPTCPEWDLWTLGVHLYQVHTWATAIVRSGEVAQRPAAPTVQDSAALAATYAHSAAGLLDTLRQTDPDAPCWTFNRHHRQAGFWFRRQALETVVHRIDAELASGIHREPDAWVAADGVDEVLTVILPRLVRSSGQAPPLPASLLIHSTDTGHAWRLDPPPEADDGEATAAPQVAATTEADDAGAARVSGTAADLLTVLWKRRRFADSALRIEGDDVLATAFLRAGLTT